MYIDEQYEEFLLNLHPNFEETPEWMPQLLRKLIPFNIPKKKRKKKNIGRKSTRSKKRKKNGGSTEKRKYLDK